MNRGLVWLVVTWGLGAACLPACGLRGKKTSEAGADSSMPQASASPPVEGAVWSAHCEAAAKRRVACAFDDDETAARSLALCKKTQKCALARYRADANPLIMACAEKGDCEDDCPTVAAEKLAPSAAEQRVVRTCLAKFADSKDGCNSFARDLRLLDEGGEDLERCIAESNDFGMAQFCAMGTPQMREAQARDASRVCESEAAPEEFQAAMLRERGPLPERARADAFGSTLPVALGAPVPVRPGRAGAKASKTAKVKPKDGKDAFAWTYAGLPMLLSYEPAKGKVSTIHFEVKGGTKEPCKRLAQAVTEEIGPPSGAARGTSGIIRVWKGTRVVVSVGLWGTNCEGTLATKGSDAWTSLTHHPNPSWRGSLLPSTSFDE